MDRRNFLVAASALAVPSALARSTVTVYKSNQQAWVAPNGVKSILEVTTFATEYVPESEGEKPFYVHDKDRAELFIEIPKKLLSRTTFEKLGVEMQSSKKPNEKYVELFDKATLISYADRDDVFVIKFSWHYNSKVADARSIETFDQVKISGASLKFGLVDNNEKPITDCAGEGTESECSAHIAEMLFYDEDNEFGYRSTVSQADSSLRSNVSFKESGFSLVHFGSTKTLIYAVRDFNSGKLLEVFSVSLTDIFNNLISNAKQVADKNVRAIENGEGTQSDCVITTASCALLGYADDCFVLNQLRAFRDRYVSKQEDQAYREMSKAILSNGFLSGKNGRSQARKLYWLYLVPGALLARLKLDAWCYAWYKNMVVNVLQR